MRILLPALVMFVSTALFGQSDNPSKDFEFWIGKWKTTMSVPPAWKEKEGIDEVTYLLNETLIEEVFTKNLGQTVNFQRGYLTYLRREKRWKHTIYDAKWGEYTFYGNKVGDKLVLQSDASDSRPGQRRETFYNISDSGFEYLWEASYDNGATWRREWKVVYQRISDSID